MKGIEFEKNWSFYHSYKTLDGDPRYNEFIAVDNINTEQLKNMAILCCPDKLLTTNLPSFVSHFAYNNHEIIFNTDGICYAESEEIVAEAMNYFIKNPKIVGEILQEYWLEVLKTYSRADITTMLRKPCKEGYMVSS